MATYLLLRNNKETGPYELADLLVQQLKAYDLVWVQGRSAAWRYPCEIDELKAHAPVAEEQPFDRFYKKKIAKEPVVQQEQEEKVAENKEEKTTAIKETSPYEDYLPKAVKEEKKATSKSVFVTLPAKPAQPANKPKPIERIAVPTIIVDQTATVQQTLTQNFDQGNTLNGSFDDIKDQYARQLQDRKYKINRKNGRKLAIKNAAIIVGLIGVGVLAGFIIKPQSAAQEKKAALSQHTDAIRENAHAVSNAALPTQEDSDDPIPHSTLPQETNSSAIHHTSSSTTANSRYKEEIPDPLTKEQLASIRLRKETMIATPEMEKRVEEKYNFAASEKDVVTGERKKVVRDEKETPNIEKSSATHSSSKETIEKENKAIPKNNWAKMVTVSSNDYKKVPLGGIRNLQLTVTNNSAQPIQEVIVELQYLRPNNEPAKTENIVFRSIASNESATVRVADTNRGVKIAYRVLQVQSTDQGLSNR